MFGYEDEAHVSISEKLDYPAVILFEQINKVQEMVDAGTIPKEIRTDPVALASIIQTLAINQLIVALREK